MEVCNRERNRPDSSLALADSPMTRNQSEMAKRMNKIKALETDDIARVIEFILDQPPHCSISEVMIRPTEREL
jgi:NADP-dependent 3-hydroxy acid dehydrogenase YdfG